MYLILMTCKNIVRKGKVEVKKVYCMYLIGLYRHLITLQVDFFSPFTHKKSKFKCHSTTWTNFFVPKMLTK